MRLLLDEMIPAVIAEELRSRGHDAVAVQECSDLRGLCDARQFDRAQQEARVMVTYNRDDYLALDRGFRAAGRLHAGLVIVNTKRFPQQPSVHGPVIASLDAFMRAGEPYPGFVHWLQ